VGGQFAPMNRPEATGIELSEDDGHAAPVPVGINVDWGQLRAQKARLVELADPHSKLGGDADLDGIVGLLDDIQDQAAEVLGEKAVFGDLDEDADADDLDGADDADDEIEACDECGAELVEGDELVVDRHAVWCSLHPGNVVDGSTVALPHGDDPRIASSGGIGDYEQFLATSTPLLIGELRRFSAGIEVAAADRLDRQHGALRGIQALLSDPRWDSPADRLEQIAMLIEGAGYAHEAYRPEVGEQVELQLADRTVVGRIEMVDGDETLVVPNAGTRPFRVTTGEIKWDRDGQTWFHAPEGED
jgi:hypothetical protein